jgi:hypothetical protein
MRVLKYVLNCEQNFSYFYLDYTTSVLTVNGLARVHCIYKKKGAHLIHHEIGNGAPFILDKVGNGVQPICYNTGNPIHSNTTTHKHPQSAFPPISYLLRHSCYMPCSSHPP